ncbi:MAG: hypothetical protein KKF41_04020 [Actinobacteria bacterium]|nr:hypothetical protein [Actinomycetota bacterium]MBU2686733.1 hypothetical protein [Actinomycetota bacterium]
MWSNSMELLKASWAVLRKEKSLVIFPIVSGILSIVLIAALIVPVYFLTGIKDGNVRNNPLFYVFFFIFYFVTSFVVFFFNTGLIACTQEVMRGGDPDFSYGFNIAMQNVGKIAGWALVNATVGVILRIIRERLGIFGVIIAGLAGLAWNLITFFVIPVLIFQGYGVIDAVKESAKIFRRTWGENVVARFSLGLIFLLLGIVGVVPIALAFLTGSGPVIIGAIGIALAYWAVLAVVSTSLTGILSTALYDYAVTGQVPAPYDAQMIAAAFRPKQRRGMFSR